MILYFGKLGQKVKVPLHPPMDPWVAPSGAHGSCHKRSRYALQSWVSEDHVCRLRVRNAVQRVDGRWFSRGCVSLHPRSVEATETRWSEADCRNKVRARRPRSQGMTDQGSGQCRRFVTETGIGRNTSDFDTSQWRANSSSVAHGFDVQRVGRFDGRYGHERSEWQTLAKRPPGSAGVPPASLSLPRLPPPPVPPGSYQESTPYG